MRRARLAALVLVSGFTLGTVLLVALSDGDRTEVGPGLIAFISNRESNDAEIWVADPDGSDIRRLTNFGEGHAFGRLIWSPDGEEILFSLTTFGETSDSSDIYVIGVNGGARRLTRLGLSQGLEWMAWSPDGEEIVYSVRTEEAIRENAILA
ncbi:MAG: TolB family protein, partial [bacterium]